MSNKGAAAGADTSLKPPATGDSQDSFLLGRTFERRSGTRQQKGRLHLLCNTKKGKKSHYIRCISQLLNNTTVKQHTLE
jgi:hypothetical protein